MPRMLNDVRVSSFSGSRPQTSNARTGQTHTTTAPTQWLAAGSCTQRTRGSSEAQLLPPRPGRPRGKGEQTPPVAPVEMAGGGADGGGPVREHRSNVPSCRFVTGPEADQLACGRVKILIGSCLLARWPAVAIVIAEEQDRRSTFPGPVSPPPLALRPPPARQAPSWAIAAGPASVLSTPSARSQKTSLPIFLLLLPIPPSSPPLIPKDTQTDRVVILHQRPHLLCRSSN